MYVCVYHMLAYTYNVMTNKSTSSSDYHPNTSTLYNLQRMTYVKGDRKIKK